MTETPIPTVVVESEETPVPKKSRVRLYVAIAAGVTAAAVITYLATRDKKVDEVLSETPSDELWTPTEV